MEELLTNRAGEKFYHRTIHHLGLVGAFIKGSGIIETIDEKIPKTSNCNNAHFTHGQVVALMIINGLGHPSRPLYMTHQYFRKKDVETILGFEFKPEWFNDDVIGRTLDVLFEYGLTPLFSELSFNVMKYLGRKVSSVNIDRTTFHFLGVEEKFYNDNNIDPYGMPHKINITRGYSRDAHPGLVPLMEQMIIDNTTGIPLFMEPESGNSNDFIAFQRIVRFFDNFKEYTDDGYVYLSGDAALYTSDNVKLMQDSGIKFVTRAADGKLKSVQTFIAEHQNDELSVIDEVNKGRIYSVQDCGVSQKWLLVYSKAAESRNEHSVERFAAKELEKQNKRIAEFQNTYYACETDADKEMQKFKKKCNSYCKVVKAEIIKEEIPKKGRKPKVAKSDEEKQYRYKLDIQVAIDEDYCSMVKRNRSCFVVATNDVDREWEPGELLKQYNSQSRVESGFRFLKDLEFSTDPIFLSKTERLQSLFTIMALNLVVFNGLEWKLQNEMKVTETKLKNQLGKPVDKITLRFVFQQFQDFTITVYEDGYRLFDPLTEQQNKILKLLGQEYLTAYGLI